MLLKPNTNSQSYRAPGANSVRSPNSGAALGPHWARWQQCTTPPLCLLSPPAHPSRGTCCIYWFTFPDHLMFNIHIWFFFKNVISILYWYFSIWWDSGLVLFFSVVDVVSFSSLSLFQRAGSVLVWQVPCLAFLSNSWYRLPLCLSKDQTLSLCMSCNYLGKLSELLNTNTWQLWKADSLLPWGLLFQLMLLLSWLLVWWLCRTKSFFFPYSFNFSGHMACFG